MFNDIYKMTVEDNALFAKRNIVDSIYKSARLEGIAVTYPETYEIFEGRAVAGLSVEDTVKVNNLKRAWRFILETSDYPLDLRYIRQINYEIGAGIVQNPGLLRTSDVAIGGTARKPEIPDYDRCTADIAKVMATDQSATEKALDIMLYICRSQMFYDGNKRTATLAANQILIRSGAGVLTIPVEKQEEFLQRLIEFYESNEPRALKNFLYSTSIKGIQEKAQRCAEETPTNREEFYRRDTGNTDQGINKKGQGR